MITRFRIGTVFTVIAALLSATLATAEKPKITSQDDIPRFEYDLDVKATDILTDPEAYQALAGRVQADLEKLISENDIEDRSTLQGILSTLMLIDLQNGDHDAALERLAMVRDLEAKPANKLTTGVLMESVIAARSKDYATDEAYRAAFAKIYAEKINALPYEVVGDNIKGAKGSAEIVTDSLLIGLIDSQVQPGLDKTGTVSGDVAQALISRRSSIEAFNPLQAERVAVMQSYVDANHVEKEDIWADRNVTLEDSADLHPVTVAIWDSGIDNAIFQPMGKVWVNEAEAFDDSDTDGNGKVDDVNGIAFDLKSNPSSEMLYPLNAEQLAAYPEQLAMTKGLLDLQANIDSPEASDLRSYLSKIAPDEVEGFIENLGLYGNYTHGTHVAGIAAAGNPAVRLMTSRITFDYRTIPDVPTIEQSHKDAAAMKSYIGYMAANGARIANMSWGGNPQGIEAAFEANGAGGTPEERRKISREIFEIQLEAITEAIKAAPEVLFVVSSGNSDNDAEFSDMYPSGIDLPNILTVGAVDQAGEETSFSTFGSNVDVHANGFEVPSYVPGGQILNFSGTSMASPNVSNLAAKLLAVHPDLTVNQLVSLITLASDRSEDGRINLINPKRSFQLLEVLMQDA
ncbi:MAG: S8 family serine peptidase [Opitutaceae bacterium]|jgi:subtilisin family serine protease|nr:S8 family serine peptidase [Opitutaceae bacterium]